MKTVESVRTVTDESKRKVDGRWRKSRKFYLVALALFLSGTVGSVLAVIGNQAYNTNYRHYLSLAHTGLQDLRTAVAQLDELSQNPFDTASIDRARHEFAGAHTAFVQLDNGLESIPGIGTLVPIYGSRLSAALHLASAAVDLSQAGVVSCGVLDILVNGFSHPPNTQGYGLTMAGMRSIDQGFQQVKVALGQAIAEAKQVQAGDVQFIPQVGKMFTTFQSELPAVQTWLDEVGKLLPVLPTMLGIGSAPAHYLIEVLDSTELRPAGGFIGNYGIATFSGGRLASAHITDVDLLDKPFKYGGHTIPYPPANSWFSQYLAPQSWSLRDSNLDADFPTAAKYGELNYQREGGNIPVQGVIAITPAFIQHALAITGPIYVPDYGETVTAQNLVSLIHFHQLGGSAAGEGSDNVLSPDGHSSLRKRFMELLAEHFMARVQQLPPATVAKFLRLLVSSLHAKDMQIYFNAGSAENVMQLLHLADTIQSPPGDHLFIVDANVAADKANGFIVNRVNDQVTIDERGNAVHRTTISYAWTLPGRNYGSPIYKDYARIYVPPGSTLSVQDGWQPHGASTAFGSEVWAGYFTLAYGQTRTITLVWTSHGAAKKDASGWHYQYLLQRQAGIQRTLQLQVILPSCAVMTSRSGGPVPGMAHVATLDQAWTEDVDLGLTYIC